MLYIETLELLPIEIVLRVLLRLNLESRPAVPGLLTLSLSMLLKL